MIGRKGEAVAIGAAGFLLLLAPVLFLVNRRDALYLYAPSAFFAILWVGLAQRAIELAGWAVARRSAAH
jgi:dolichyl-phosphate-mannose--protein O-mannosyl transferase